VQTPSIFEKIVSQKIAFFKEFCLKLKINQMCFVFGLSP
jgi:hypothetical protein